jgi:acetylornithine/N-succinyldiaminopimelate aminotransferase
VRLLPPLIVTEAEIEEAVQRLDRACTVLSGEQSKRATVQ